MLQTLLAAVGPGFLTAAVAEPLRWPFWLGMACVLGGVVVVQRAARDGG